MQRFTRHQHLQRWIVGLAAVLLAVAVFPLSGGRAAASSSTTLTMSGQTQFADASSDQPWTDNGPTLGAINSDVSIFQGGGQTALYFNVYTFQSDPIAGWQYVPLAWGFGTIPSSAVHFTGGAKPTTATLSVDTSTLSTSDFQSWGPTGLVSVTWSLTPESSYSSSGSSRSTFGYDAQYISTVTGGAWYNHSAQAIGSVVGYTMPNAGANNSAIMGSSQGVSICRNCSVPTGP